MQDIYFGSGVFNTMIPITVNNIRKNLMMLGYKNLPTIQDIYKLFDKYNVRPYDVRYSKKRYHPSVMLFVQQHIKELWDMQDEDEYAEMMSTLNKGKDDEESETSVSYYHPKGMSNASMELLKNDDVWYENKEAKTVKNMNNHKTVYINESQMRLLNEYVDYTDTEEFKHIFHDIISRVDREWDYDLWKMHAVDGLSFDEIGDRYGCTAQTAKKRYNKFIDKAKSNPFVKKMLYALLNGDLNTKNVESLFNEYGGTFRGKNYVERYKDERKRKGPLMGFDDVGEFYEGFARVQRGRWPWSESKYNYINKQGKLLSDKWFDFAGDFIDGFSLVSLGDKYYRIDTKGRLHKV